MEPTIPQSDGKAYLCERHVLEKHESFPLDSL